MKRLWFILLLASGFLPGWRMAYGFLIGRSRLEKAMQFRKWLFSAGISLMVGCGGSELPPSGEMLVRTDSVVSLVDGSAVPSIDSSIAVDTTKAAPPLELKGGQSSKSGTSQGNPAPDAKDRVPGMVENLALQAKYDSLNLERQRRHDSIRAANGGVSPPRKPK